MRNPECYTNTFTYLSCHEQEEDYGQDAVASFRESVTVFCHHSGPHVPVTEQNDTMQTKENDVGKPWNLADLKEPVRIQWTTPVEARVRALVPNEVHTIIEL
jgi:hypothetical protein